MTQEIDAQPKPLMLGIDAYSPAEIAERVERIGVTKAQLPLLPTLALGVLAGAFIAFGAMFFTLVMTESGLGYGPSRLLGGVAFSLGLIFVVIGGAELFTGNNLIVMAWADKKVKTRDLLRNWGIVYVANFIGAIGCVILIYLSGILEMNNGAMAQTAANIATSKVNLTWLEAFTRGILCNTLVCLAVWLCFAAHTVSGKILSILFPISAFVALGFEHSVANMYLIPVGWLTGADVSLVSFAANLIPVTLGNIIGGSLFVALTYWVIYLRK